MARTTALEAILLECGYSVVRAAHVAKTLDRLRLCCLSSDDIAAALLRWRSEAVERRWHGFELGQKCRPGLVDVPGLFDVAEEAGRERRKDGN